MLDRSCDWSIPERPEKRERLAEEVARLQHQVAFLKDSGADSLDEKTFHHLTGFRNAFTARAEFERAGGEAVLNAVDRHQTHLDSQSLNPAYEHVIQQFPGVGDLLHRSLLAVGMRRAVDAEEKVSGKAHPRVDAFHLFLLVFMYVHGGVMEYMAPFLPGIGVSQGHFSRLLVNSTPVVARCWASKYYRVRPLAWLLEYASPKVRTPTRDQEKQVVDLEKADIVLCVDGYTATCEKSDGGAEQKQIFEYQKSGEPKMRIIEVCALNGVVVEVSHATGGRKTECQIVASLRIADRINGEALAAGTHVRLHFVVDRGFYDFRASLEKGSWSNVTVTCIAPYHLVKPGKKSEAEKAAGMRKQHPNEEVLVNRGVAAVRWINEVSIGRINHARFLHRMLDLSMLHAIDDFLAIAAAQVNFALKVAPV